MKLYEAFISARSYSAVYASVDTVIPPCTNFYVLEVCPKEVRLSVYPSTHFRTEHGKQKRVYCVSPGSRVQSNNLFLTRVIFGVDDTPEALPRWADKSLVGYTFLIAYLKKEFGV